MIVIKLNLIQAKNSAAANLHQGKQIL